MAELQPPEGQINGGAAAGVSSENIGGKRQRRPSVRLGDIGDQPYDSHVNRRSNKQWKLPMESDAKYRKESGNIGKASKTRPLMNLSTGGGEFSEALEGEDKEGNLDSVAIGSWKVKDSKKRGPATKRVRSNWVSKVDEGGGGGGGGGGGEGDEKFSGGEDVDDGFRDFENEDSDSPLKEQSPIHSLENMAVDHGNDREVLGRGRCQSREDGVRDWLNELGLGRYAPVFEIHEVDEQVLPMLTLEDLKDMGINAVGSRRKMYCAIQKLNKGFS
uniref:SAM domain-containing protein n=1 Tax=Vitis vinifera TaxID=29760 RepID=F6GT11_VITVI